MIVATVTEAPPQEVRQNGRGPITGPANDESKGPEATVMQWNDHRASPRDTALYWKWP
jgi:hypothetical protein